MRLLLIHADYIEYEVRERTKLAEDFEGKGDRIEEVLVVFTSVEKGDNEEVVKKAIEEIKDVAKKSWGRKNSDLPLRSPFIKSCRF